MKMLRILVLFIGISPYLSAQVAENTQVSAILKNATLDSVQKTERLAAILFHNKINEHRAVNGKSRLGWDDTLWLAARNHNLWMVDNDELNHHEKPGTKSFTGDGPGDRYEFASRGKGKCSWSGENCLYNYAQGNSTIEKNAEHIAEYSFQQWKSSPGHNANMLNGGSRVHGVAFYISKDGRVWATDIFSYPPHYSPIVENPSSLPTNVSFSDPEPIVSAAAPVTKKATDSKSSATKFVSASSKYVRLNLEETSQSLCDGLYDAAGVKKNKSLARAAQHHADYMAANQKVVHDEKKQKRKFYAGSPHQRIVKASRGAKFFHKRSASYVESIAMVQADAAALDSKALSKLIMLALSSEKKENAGNVSTVGFGITIKRVKNELRIYVVREEIVN
ncbi:hypothetical protein BH09BAC5_BH09BAC5_09180 [soil metagenome]